MRASVASSIIRPDSILWCWKRVLFFSKRYKFCFSGEKTRNKKVSPRVGLEPTTLSLEGSRASNYAIRAACSPNCFKSFCNCIVKHYLFQPNWLTYFSSAKTVTACTWTGSLFTSHGLWYDSFTSNWPAFLAHSTNSCLPLAPARCTSKQAKKKVKSDSSFSLLLSLAFLLHNYCIHNHITDNSTSDTVPGLMYWSDTFSTPLSSICFTAQE